MFPQWIGLLVISLQVTVVLLLRFYYLLLRLQHDLGGYLFILFWLLSLLVSKSGETELSHLLAQTSGARCCSRSDQVGGHLPVFVLFFFLVFEEHFWALCVQCVFVASTKAISICVPSLVFFVCLFLVSHSFLCFFMFILLFMSYLHVL